MTPAQLKMARHALGLPNDRKRSYRNRYFAPVNTYVEAGWNDLVARGFAERGDGIRNIEFRLTEAGARMAIDPTESLDAEDFPSVTSGLR